MAPFTAEISRAAPTPGAPLVTLERNPGTVWCGSSHRHTPFLSPRISLDQAKNRVGKYDFRVPSFPRSSFLFDCLLCWVPLCFPLSRQTISCFLLGSLFQPSKTPPRARTLSSPARMSQRGRRALHRLTRRPRKKKGSA